ncbi:hypothetical protein HAX54_012254 [Datura stramonium]|uniref:Uncharacterized protein n=1 Tax=Datura stramonium TaxID=4076 RepID=A0ABS8TLB1_DATST|nr:hypothetical protein [Datura stramonium]
MGNEDEQHEIRLVPSSAEQVNVLALNEGTLLETDSSNVSSKSRQELENSGGTIPEAVVRSEEGTGKKRDAHMASREHRKVCTSRFGPDPSDESFAQDSLSDSASENDLVTIFALKKGARKRKLTSSQEVGSGSKNPYVFDPAFLTRARWNSSYDSTAIPKPTIPKSKLKAQPAWNEDTAMARHQDLMALIRSLSPSIDPSSSVAPPTDLNP